jgi:hypothetical protein
MYWFNTLQFTRPELLRFPCYAPARLARRAHSYLLLGFSLPLVLDLGTHATPAEYLRALHALLAEFDQYQAAHPPEGTSSTGSLSRARIPQMFKRAVAAGSGAGKSRRLTDAGLGPGAGAGAPSAAAGDGAAGGGAILGAMGAAGGGQVGGGAGAAGAGSFGHGHHGAGPAAFPAEPLLPSEQYAHLLTPALPFDPDFFETFATLCDVLIDCYARVTQLVDAPDACAPVGGSGSVGELFAKADAKLRKVIVSGIMREFEERCRDGIKGEIAGIGKVALGGLM